MTDNGQREQTRLALGSTLVPLFFAIGFALCIIGVYHKPHPHNIKVAVVGPPAQTAPLRAGLEKAAGSAFDIRAGGDGRRSGAWSPPAPPHRGLRAHREPAAARDRDHRQRGRPPGRGSVRDLVRSVTTRQGANSSCATYALPSGDEIGLGVFMFMIACTIAGYIAVTVLQTVAPDLAPPAAIRSSRRSPWSSR